MGGTGKGIETDGRTVTRFRERREDWPQDDEVGCGGAFDIRQRMAGDGDEETRGEMGAKVRSRGRIAAEVDAVEAGGQGDIETVIDEDPGAVGIGEGADPLSEGELVARREILFAKLDEFDAVAKVPGDVFEERIEPAKWVTIGNVVASNQGLLMIRFLGDVYDPT